MSDLETLEYNALDSLITRECADKFMKEVWSGGHGKIYQQTIDLLQPLMYIMTRGIAVNQENIKIVKIETRQKIEEKQEQLNKLVGRTLNINSPKQVKTYFYVEKNIKPFLDQKTKRPTTDDKALARIAAGSSTRKPYHEARLIQELRGLHKLMGTYLEIEYDDDMRFRTSINPRGTKFSRISTGKTIFGTGMNMQNLPPVFKRFLVPDPEYLMFDIDKRQAEWVVVAFDCGDANMMQVILDGEDPHVHTAHLMFKADKDLIRKDSKLVGHSTDPTEIERIRRNNLSEIFELGFVPRIFSMRQGGKKSNHALNYDETYKRFALENEMSEKESKWIVEMYHDAYPAIRQNFEFIQNQLRDTRMLTNCFGRKQKFLEEWGSELFKQAYSFIPQSTVGDLINQAMNLIYYSTDPKLQPVEMLAQVHDSILFQVPFSHGTDNIMYAIDRIEDFMNPTMEYHSREFTIGTDLKIGTDNWGELEEVDLTDKKNLRERINELSQA